MNVGVYAPTLRGPAALGGNPLPIPAVVRTPLPIATGSDASQAAYLPATIRDCVCWLDATAAGTLWQDGNRSTPAAVGDPVGLWLDRSGNGYNATQTVNNNRPTATATSLSFNGTSNSLSISGMVLNHPTTVFVVAKSPTSASANRYLFGRMNSSGNGGLTLQQATTDMRWQLYANTAPYSQVVARGTGQQIWTCVCSNQRASLRQNGGSVSRVTWAWIAQAPHFACAIGRRADSASNYWDSEVSEIICYARELTLAEINAVQAWLAAKWSVTVAVSV